ncbi:MAG: lipase family protein [Myxococcota bacterium]
MSMSSWWKSLLPVLVASCSQPSEPGAPDASAPVGFPAPQVAGTAETDALANNPARCGQPSHVWLRSDELGTTVSRTEPVHNTADYLDGLAAAGDLTLPNAPFYDAKVTTITYRTQDRGVMLEATALVAWPFGLPRDAPPAPVLLVLHGTQGFTDGCSLDRDATGKLLASYFATLGYVVVAPDYLGLKASGPPTGFPHPYLVGQATAIAALDAVRATGRTPPDEMDDVVVSPRVVMLGGSQGGHAALWVDRLAPYYARELTLLGGVATVPPADLLGQAERALTELVDATGNVIAVLGASAPWYGLGSRLGEVFRSPYDVDIPAALAASCDPTDGIPTEGQLTDVFQPQLLTAASSGNLANDPFGCLFVENGLTTTSIPRLQDDANDYGLLVILGENDQLVHTPIERAAYAELCNAGVPLTYLECAGAGHTQATSWALAEIADFLEARVNGETFTPQCTVSAPSTCRGTPTP